MLIEKDKPLLVEREVRHAEFTESVGAGKTLDIVLARSRFHETKKTHANWNRSKRNPTWRGIGLATVFHGDGFTGSGEVFLKSRAGVALTPRGEIHVEAASTEIGQGTTSILAQIVSDAMEVPYDRQASLRSRQRRSRRASPSRGGSLRYRQETYVQGGRGGGSARRGRRFPDRRLALDPSLSARGFAKPGTGLLARLTFRKYSPERTNAKAPRRGVAKRKEGDHCFLEASAMYSSTSSSRTGRGTGPFRSTTS